MECANIGTRGDSMYLETYKKFDSFSNQYYFLKEYFYNFALQGRSNIIREIKKNFLDFIQNTKLETSFQFKKFYDLLLDQGCFQNELENHLPTILQAKKIDAETLYELLQTLNKEKIIHNHLIQKQLMSSIMKNYDKTYLSIIEDYLLPEFHNVLFLLQIELRIQEEIKPEKQKFLYQFIESILKDPDYGSLNIHYMGSGRYKDSFLMGDYILQIGDGPHIVNFPKSKAIISPILFYRFDEFQVSLTPLLEEVNDEERKRCWFQAKEEGILLLDARRNCNFGKFKKDDIHPFKNISPLGKQFLGIDPFYLGDSKKGDIRYLDIDYYVSEDDHSSLSEYFQDGLYSEYKELEYEYERQKKITKTK